MSKRPSAKGAEKQVPSGLKGRLQLLIDPPLIQRVDEWRGRQPDVPNRSKAIRRLLELALQQKR